MNPAVYCFVVALTNHENTKFDIPLGHLIVHVFRRLIGRPMRVFFIFFVPVTSLLQLELVDFASVYVGFLHVFG